MCPKPLEGNDRPLIIHANHPSSVSILWVLLDLPGTRLQLSPRPSQALHLVLEEVLLTQDRHP